MTERVRVLLVGAGQVAGDQHLPAIKALGERVELIGVCDPDAERARRLCADAGSPVPLFQDVDAALSATVPDVVLVATPPATHAMLVPACLRAGAWVVCEKPPARSLAELDTIAAVERETGNPCSFIFQQRFGASAQALRGLVDAGVTGPVRVVTAQTAWFRDEDYYRVPWRGDWDDEGGGALSSLGIHLLDLALWLSGEWTEVTALAASLDRKIAVDNVSGAVVRLAEGGLMTIATSALSLRQESRLRLDYRDATVELVHLYTHSNLDWRITAEPSLMARWQERGPDPVSQHTALLAAVLDARDRGEAPPCSGPEGRAALELVTACYAAALTGRVVWRSELTPSNPFYHRLDGHLEPWS